MKNPCALLPLVGCTLFASCRHGGVADAETILPQRQQYTIAFAGGGFGAPKKKKKNTKKKKNRSGSVLSKELGNNTVKKKPKPSEQDDSSPTLDKWGLLLNPTQDDIFPPMPPDTELIPTLSSEATLENVKSAMMDHVALNYDMFDENCVEKNPAPDAKPMKLRLLHQSPPVLSIDNFFTHAECQQIKALVESPSVSDDTLQVNSATFSPLASSKRTSTTWFCHYAQMPALIAKACQLMHIQLEQTEEPQIVRYKSGQEFSWHYDEVPPPQLSNGGQRIATLLVYLNTVKSGGGTVFRDLISKNQQEELTMQPKQGSALLFFPAFANGKPDDRTLHKGQVAQDEKWIAQMWIHQSPYTPVVPEGNSHEAALNVLEQARKQLGYES